MLLECLHFAREKEKFGQQISLSMITHFSSIIWTKKNKFLYFQTVHTNFLQIYYITVYYICGKQGWKFARRFFKWIARFLWAKEQKSDLLRKNEWFALFYIKKQPERISHGFAHGLSFVKIDARESLPSLFKKGRRVMGAKSNGSNLLLGIKKGKSSEKLSKTKLFFSESLAFAQSQANHSYCSF